MASESQWWFVSFIENDLNANAKLLAYHVVDSHPLIWARKHSEIRKPIIIISYQKIGADEAAELARAIPDDCEEDLDDYYTNATYP